jgi:hypothetical protein
VRVNLPRFFSCSPELLSTNVFYLIKKKPMQQQPPFDPEQFKQVQRLGWGRSVNGMKTWWPLFEEGGQKLSDKLIELAGVRPGSKVLDVATGIGEPAVTLQDVFNLVERY